MGLFNRNASPAAGTFWKYLQVRADERPIGYASLRCVSGRESLLGTLFLTNRRLVWIAGDPKRPLGGFEAKLDDVLGCGPIEGVNDPGSFRVGMTIQGQNGVLLFYPQRPDSRANVQLAQQMYDSIGDTLSDHWQSATPPSST